MILYLSLGFLGTSLKLLNGSNPIDAVPMPKPFEASLISLKCVQLLFAAYLF
jgi:hypothetical protein